MRFLFPDRSKYCMLVSSPRPGEICPYNSFSLMSKEDIIEFIQKNRDKAAAAQQEDLKDELR